MFILTPPCNSSPEAQYIFKVVFNEILRLPFRIASAGKDSSFQIEIEGHKTRLLVPSVFLEWLDSNRGKNCPYEFTKVEQVLTDTLITNPSVCERTFCAEHLPVFFCDSSVPGWLVAQGHDTILKIDIFGTAFFFLSRYEELSQSSRDSHGRCPYKGSIAALYQLANRPLINELSEYLWWVMQMTWPDLNFKNLRQQKNFTIQLSHDVDHPYLFVNSPKLRLARRVAGDLFKRADLPSAVRNIFSLVGAGDRHNDPFDTFDWLMQTSEEFNTKSIFNFFGGQPGGIEPSYNVTSQSTRKLLRQIIERGHLIGFHGSYASFDNPHLLKSELTALQRVVNEEGLGAEVISGRQHYLRWSPERTWQDWDQAGLQVDSTLGWAEQIGFRAGIADPFTCYDLTTRSELHLVEQPLLIMDGTLFGQSYMALNNTEALDSCTTIIKNVKKFNGTLSVLWHNDFFANNPGSDKFYQQLLELSTK